MSLSWEHFMTQVYLECMSMLILLPFTCQTEQMCHFSSQIRAGGLTTAHCPCWECCRPGPAQAAMSRSLAEICRRTSKKNLSLAVVLQPKWTSHPHVMDRWQMSFLLDWKLYTPPPQPTRSAAVPSRDRSPWEPAICLWPHLSNVIKCREMRRFILR